MGTQGAKQTNLIAQRTADHLHPHTERIARTGVAAAAGDDTEVTAHLRERGQVDVGFFGASMRWTIKTQIIDLSVVIASELFLT
jgi:hypothetical protein